MVSELEGQVLPPALARRRGLGITVPRQIERAGEEAIERYLEFFLARIRNPNTRESYHRSVLAFFAWCTAHELDQLPMIKALHVSTYIEGLEQGAWNGKPLAASSIKAHLAALRSFFNWLEVCGHVSRNPTSPVAGPTVRAEKGLTPALTRAEARRLLDSIMVEQRSADSGSIQPDLLGHRDRALIAFMIYSCARVGAALAVKVRDLQRQDDPESGRSVLWVTLHEKRGKILKRPCHEALDLYLTTYLRLGGFGPDEWLFPSYSHPRQHFTSKALDRNSAQAHDPAARRGSGHHDQDRQSQPARHRDPRHR